jgi:phage terminase large subunit-like protein
VGKTTAVEREIKELEEILLDLERQEKEVIAVNPYWFYTPSDGSISDAGREIFKKYLRPEDIPDGPMDCQLDVHKSDADITLCAGGNQVGKSTVGAITGYIWVTGELPHSLEGQVPESMIPKEWPQHVRVEGVDYPTMQKNVIPAFRHWAPKEYLENGEWDKSFSVQDQILTLGRGGKLVGTVEFMNNRQNVESHQGPPRHGMIYDEEPRFEIWKENLMRFTTAERIKILMAMTPTKGLSWVHDEVFLKQESGDTEFTIQAYALASVTNKYANVKNIRKILSGQDSYQAIKMRLLGEFVSLSGLIYGTTFNRRVHVIEPFKIDKDNYVVPLCVSSLRLTEKEMNTWLECTRRPLIQTLSKQTLRKGLKKEIIDLHGHVAIEVPTRLFKYLEDEMFFENSSVARMRYRPSSLPRNTRDRSAQELIRSRRYSGSMRGQRNPN